MAERVEHPYECQAAGHTVGSRIFMSAPPEWFAAKGLNEPKVCKLCKAWMRQQIDSKVLCATQNCHTIVPLPARYKISFYRHHGPFMESEQKCYDCRDGKAPEEKMKNAPKKRRVKKDRILKEHPFEGIGFTGAVAINLVMEPEVYYELPYRKNTTESRYDHLWKHLECSEPTQHGASVSALGGENPDHQIALVQRMIVNSSADDVRELYQGTDIVRYTLLDDNHIEKTIFHPFRDGMYYLGTSFNNIELINVYRAFGVERKF